MSANAPTDAAVSFMDALKQRYGATDEEALGGALVQDKKWQFVGAAKAAKRQGEFDRLTLVVLRDCGVSCAFSPGETSEENGVKAAKMHRLTDLDLSANTALTLGEIGKLLPFFENLTTLQVCDIPTLLLLPHASTSEQQQQQDHGEAGSAAATTKPALSSAPHLTPASPLLMSAKLSKLVLNNSGFSSLAQLRALIALPALTELHLDSNNLTALELTSTDAEAHGVAAADAAAAIAFPRVTTLSLAHNKLSDWTAIGVAITQAFPALTQLFLTDNKLNDLILPDELIARAAAALPIPAGGDASEKGETAEQQMDWTPEEAAQIQPYRYLQSLTLLCLKDNATLTNPATVDAVRVLCPRLRTFRITYSFLLPTWNETNSRMYVVAALPTITLLNRGTVRPKERLDSELLYIQRGLQQRTREAEGDKKEEENEKNSTNDNNAAERVTPTHIPYPLVDVLREKHKDVVLSIQKEGETATMAGANYLMLNVTLYFVNGYAAATTTAASSPQSRQPQRLPSSLTVAKLKSLVQKLFQVKPVNQKLSYRSGDHGVLETQTPLDNEQETLGYYGVPDGAILYVEDTSLRS